MYLYILKFYSESFMISHQAFEQYTVAFYNLENLFDPYRDTHIRDDEFTEYGSREWTEQRYLKKLKKLSDAISKIATERTGKMPALIGVAEVENKKVLTDLVEQPKLKNGRYNFIHFNSPDERGIDVALLYNEQLFEVITSQPINVLITDEDGSPDSTRDILYVHGKLADCPVHIYVNHWPSRRNGPQASNHKRVAVAQQLLTHINSIDPAGTRLQTGVFNEQAQHVIVIGDFNDEPHNESINDVLVESGMENLMAPLKKYHRGSLNHHFKWSLFDQILISPSLKNDVANELYVHTADIFDDIMLREWKGRYRGHPARTFRGSKYIGGYSDHFPVYTILRRN